MPIKPKPKPIPLNLSKQREERDREGISTTVVRIKDLPRKLTCVLLLAGGDLLGWAGGLLLASAIYHALSPSKFNFSSYLSLWWFPLLGLAFFAFEGLYTQRRALWDEVRALWRALTLTHLAALPTFFFPLGLTAGRAPLSALFPVMSWPILLLLSPLVRLTVKKLLPRAGLWRKRVLILGTGRAGELALKAIERDPVLGYEVVGLLADDRDNYNYNNCNYLTNRTMGRRATGQRAINLGRDQAAPGTGSKGTARIWGSISQIQQVFERTDCRDVLIAMPQLSQEELLQLIYRLQESGKGQMESVRLIPDIGFLSMVGVRIDQLLPERLFMVTLADNLAKPWNLWLKRAFDLIMGSVLALLALPVIGLLGLLIRLDSPGPVFYIHERLGQGGQPFRCYKFRSMYLDGDQRLEEYLEQNPQAREEWEAYRKLKTGDPRVTPIGRFLRSWSLDELPQLFNVLRGEMSLIGPRPYLPEERELAGPELNTILQTKPGITGLWQVTGKNELPFAERVQMEAWYVRNWSPWLDLIILIRTVRTVLKREGAY